MALTSFDDVSILKHSYCGAIKRVVFCGQAGNTGAGVDGVGHYQAFKSFALSSFAYRQKTVKECDIPRWS